MFLIDRDYSFAVASAHNVRSSVSSQRQSFKKFSVSSVKKNGDYLRFSHLTRAGNQPREAISQSALHATFMGLINQHEALSEYSL